AAAATAADELLDDDEGSGFPFNLAPPLMVMLPRLTALPGLESRCWSAEVVFPPALAPAVAGAEAVFDRERAPTATAGFTSAAPARGTLRLPVAAAAPEAAPEALAFGVFALPLTPVLTAPSPPRSSSLPAGAALARRCPFPFPLPAVAPPPTAAVGCRGDGEGGGRVPLATGATGGTGAAVSGGEGCAAGAGAAGVVPGPRVWVGLTPPPPPPL
ncbi:unnamed protein product, partial [Ectocarpus sp. 12 AP-2014]